MASILPMEKQTAIIGALAEGSGIRQIERMTGVHRDTIMRLGVRVGQGCAELLDSKTRNLSCRRLRFDEIWGSSAKRNAMCARTTTRLKVMCGPFCAIDPETKLVPAYKAGKRDLATVNAFVADVASRLRNRVQISADTLWAYVEAMLTELDALFTARLAAGSPLPVFRLDFLALEAIVMVVIDLSVFWRLFDRVGVVRRYFCHLTLSSLEGC
ncbi:MAG TPA: hypothetical protein VKS44_10055 [Candidatus Acidoferrales bacterium]|nr:hypothetical protein [Candidatus Acidoferrales bacterium]